MCEPLDSLGTSQQHDGSLFALCLSNAKTAVKDIFKTLLLGEKKEVREAVILIAIETLDIANRSSFPRGEIQPER